MLEQMSDPALQDGTCGHVDRKVAIVRLPACSQRWAHGGGRIEHDPIPGPVRTDTVGPAPRPRQWVWVGLIREWNARHGRPPKWVTGQSERSTLPRNGGGFVGLLVCPLPRFPRHVRIFEDCDQSRCLLAGTTMDGEPAWLLCEAAFARLSVT